MADSTGCRARPVLTLEAAHNDRSHGAYRTAVQTLIQHLTCTPRLFMCDRNLALHNGVLEGVADLTGIAGG